MNVKDPGSLCSLVIIGLYLLIYKFNFIDKSCLVLSHFQLFCDPMNCSLPCSSVHGISQARMLEFGCHFLLQGIFLIQ